jgi:hypothetical protein
MNSSSISSGSSTSSKVSRHPEYIQLRVNGVTEAEAKAQQSSESSEERKSEQKIKKLPKKKKKLRRMTKANLVSEFNFGLAGLQATANAMK